MRVTNRSIFEATRTRLGYLTEKLSDANTVLSSGKRINKLSDDPTGLAQVVDINSLIANLGQLQQNISTGKLWLNSQESALGSIRDLTLDMKTLSITMRNDSYNDSQRATASDSVNSTLKQIVSLANSTVKGQYVFSGTKTDTISVVMDDLTNPTKIEYKGNQNSFGVKIGQSNDVPVGLIGKELFWEDYLMVDSSNNKIDFSEEIVDGHNIENLNAGNGAKLEKTTVTINDYSKLIYGTSTDKLNPLSFQWDGNGNWEVSNNPGYDLPDKIKGTASGFNIDLDNDGNKDIEVNLSEPASKAGAWIEFDTLPGVRTMAATVSDGKYKPDELAQVIEKSINEASDASGYKINYKVTYDSDTKKFIIKDNGSYPGVKEFKLLWSSGDNKAKSIGHDLGFDVNDISSKFTISDNDVTLFTFDNNNNKINFVEYPEGGGNSGELTAVIENGQYGDIKDLTNAIEDAMNLASRDSGNRVDYKVSYDKTNKKFIIKEKGVVLDQLDINWTSGGNSAQSAGNTLGYSSDSSIVLPKSDVSAPGGPPFTINNTINSLEFTEVHEREGQSQALLTTVADGTYNTGDDLAEAIEEAMENVSVNKIDYHVAYDNVNNTFTIKPNNGVLNELIIPWTTTTSGIGSTIGFTADDDIVFPESDDPRGSMITFDNTTNKIDFKETNEMGIKSKELTATVPVAMQTGTSGVTAGTLNTSDLTINGIDITASGALTVKDDDSDLALVNAINNNESLKTLGISAERYSDGTSYSIRLFSDNSQITIAGNDPATIAHLTAGTTVGYTDPDDLAYATEHSLEKASVNQIDYAVSYKRDTNRFTIEENTTSLQALDLLWESGTNKNGNMADTMGYDKETNDDDPNSGDDIITFPTSNKEAEWGLFKTLIDFRDYLKNNDVEGINRTMTRLDTHYSHIVGSVSDIGQRETRMDVKQQIIDDLNVSYKERKSTVEDADIIDAITELKTRNTAYEAALASSAKIMQLSLVDYIK